MNVKSIIMNKCMINWIKDNNKGILLIRNIDNNNRYIINGNATGNATMTFT